jgi:hypothetical protein
MSSLGACVPLMRGRATVHKSAPETSYLLMCDINNVSSMQKHSHQSGQVQWFLILFCTAQKLMIVDTRLELFYWHGT